MSLWPSSWGRTTGTPSSTEATTNVGSGGSVSSDGYFRTSVRGSTWEARRDDGVFTIYQDSAYITQIDAKLVTTVNLASASRGGHPSFPREETVPNAFFLAWFQSFMKSNSTV